MTVSKVKRDMIEGFELLIADMSIQGSTIRVVYVDGHVENVDMSDLINSQLGNYVPNHKHSRLFNNGFEVALRANGNLEADRSIIAYSGVTPTLAPRIELTNNATDGQEILFSIKGGPKNTNVSIQGLPGCTTAILDGNGNFSKILTAVAGTNNIICTFNPGYTYINGSVIAKTYIVKTKPTYSPIISLSKSIIKQGEAVVLTISNGPPNVSVTISGINLLVNSFVLNSNGNTSITIPGNLSPGTYGIGVVFPQGLYIVQPGNTINKELVVQSDIRFIEYTIPGVYQFIVPDGVTQMDTVVVSAGGAGGHPTYIPATYTEDLSTMITPEQFINGSGGGSGELVEETINVMPKQVLQITVGVGGRLQIGRDKEGQSSTIEGSFGIVEAVGGSAGNRTSPGLKGGVVGNNGSTTFPYYGGSVPGNNYGQGGRGASPDPYDATKIPPPGNYDNWDDTVLWNFNDPMLNGQTIYNGESGYIKLSW